MHETDVGLEAAFAQDIAEVLSKRLGPDQPLAYKLGSAILLVQVGGACPRLQLCERVEVTDGANCRLWGADLSSSALVQHFDGMGVQAQLSRDGLKSLGEYFAVALVDADAALTLKPNSVIQTGVIGEETDGEKHGVEDSSFDRIGKLQLLVKYKKLFDNNSVSIGHFDLNLLQDDVHLSAWEMMSALLTTSKTNSNNKSQGPGPSEGLERPRKKPKTQSTQQVQSSGSSMVFPTR
jgi:hypothetical protein